MTILLALLLITPVFGRPEPHNGAHFSVERNVDPVHRDRSIGPYRENREGMIKSLASIEQMFVPQQKRRGSDYLGAEFNPESLQYRLKFMHDGDVIWLDVDGRSGAVISQIGQ